jgi:hypothetical protein
LVIAPIHIALVVVVWYVDEVRLPMLVSRCGEPFAFFFEGALATFTHCDVCHIFYKVNSYFWSGKDDERDPSLIFCL